MKRYLSAGLFLLVAFLAGRASNTPSVQAQTPQAATFIGGGPISTCAKPVGVTYLCVGTDDIIASKSGAAPVSIFTVPVVSGVASWNGLTGAVTYTPPPAPVTSVNGKTGIVVISATTQLQ